MRFKYGQDTNLGSLANITTGRIYVILQEERESSLWTLITSASQRQSQWKLQRQLNDSLQLLSKWDNLLSDPEPGIYVEFEFK